jgi:hypothetical protein
MVSLWGLTLDFVSLGTMVTYSCLNTYLYTLWSTLILISSIASHASLNLCFMSLLSKGGTMKDRRRRPEEGKWKPIKIPHSNLTYIPKLTQRPSLLNRPRPYSYRRAIALGTRLGTTAETWIDASKNTCETDDEKSDKKQFMSSETFHQIHCERVQETAVWKRLGL